MNRPARPEPAHNKTGPAVGSARAPTGSGRRKQLRGTPTGLQGRPCARMVNKRLTPDRRERNRPARPAVPGPARRIRRAQRDRATTLIASSRSARGRSVIVSPHEPARKIPDFSGSCSHGLAATRCANPRHLAPTGPQSGLAERVPSVPRARAESNRGAAGPVREAVSRRARHSGLPDSRIGCARPQSPGRLPGAAPFSRDTLGRQVRAVACLDCRIRCPGLGQPSLARRLHQPGRPNPTRCPLTRRSSRRRRLAWFR
jgi:hypothetical protein